MEFKQTEFLYESIKDAQAVIRAIDFKANALLVIMALFVPASSRIGDLVKYFSKGSPALFAVVETLIFVGTFSWLAAVVCCFNTLKSRTDVAAHVDSEGAVGAFWDTDPRFRRALGRKLLEIPADQESTVRELAYEHLKIGHIRSEKSAYTNWGYRWGMVTLLFSLALWLIAMLNGT